MFFNTNKSDEATKNYVRMRGDGQGGSAASIAALLDRGVFMAALFLVHGWVGNVQHLLLREVKERQTEENHRYYFLPLRRRRRSWCFLLL